MKFLIKMKNKIFILIIIILLFGNFVSAQKQTEKDIKIEKIIKVLKQNEISDDKINLIKKILPRILTGNKINKDNSNSVYDYISKKARDRGYKLRKDVGERDLLEFFGKKIHRKVFPDLVALLITAALNNIKINFISGYRSIATQKLIFFNRFKHYQEREKILAGGFDKEIDKVLSRISFPGYSKHHTGQTVDFSCGYIRRLDNSFKETICYQWLS